MIATLTLCHSAKAQTRAASQPECAIDTTSPVLPACVVQRRGSDLVIPKEYWEHREFNRYKLAGLRIAGFGNVYVGRGGRIVIRDVATIDNAMDDFHHGLVRICRDGKWGFADRKGRLVVAAEYSCALNLETQWADIGPLVCSGCRREKQGEHSACVGGRWLLADGRGRLRPSPGPEATFQRRRIR